MVIDRAGNIILPGGLVPTSIELVQWWVPVLFCSIIHHVTSINRLFSPEFNQYVVTLPPVYSLINRPVKLRYLVT